MQILILQRSHTNHNMIHTKSISLSTVLSDKSRYTQNIKIEKINVNRNIIPNQQPPKLSHKPENDIQLSANIKKLRV